MLARIKRNSTTGDLEIQRLSGMSPDSIPIGVILPLYSNTVPTGFLPCNGAQFDAEQYINLYNLLGTSTLPDLRECTLVGIGENSTDTITTHDIYTLGQFKDSQSTPNSAGPTVTGNNLVLNNDTTLGASNRYVVHQYTSNPVDPATGVTRARSKGVNFIIKAITGNVTSDIENALNAKVDKTLTTPITIDETTYNTVIAALEAMAAKINSGLEAIQYVTTLPASPDIHNVIYAIMGTSKYKYYAGDEDNQTLQELGGSGSTFIGTQAQWDALTSAEQLEYDVADITDAPGDGTVVVDAVEDGNLNAVSSNAVCDLLTNYVGALNRESKDLFPKVSNVDNAVNPGFYIVAGPETYGGVLVLGNHTNRLVTGNTWLWQIYFGTSGTLYSRRATNPSSMPPTSSDWTTWKTIVTE